MVKEKKTVYVSGAVKIIENEADYRKAKVRLESLQRKSSWKTMLLIFLFIALFMAAMFFLAVFDVYTFGLKAVSLSLFAGSLIAIFVIVYLRLILEMAESSISSRINAYEAENIKDDVVEDIFENSIKMSYKYLDQYYLQTKQQAQKGFLATMLVAGFGALLIAGGIVAMYFGVVEPSYITCGSGVITEFISAVFFYLYNKTVASMSKYHNKLVLSHNISTALKVAESLPESNQIEAKNLLIAELLKDINSHMTKQDSQDD
jgi:hypothetical protein